MKKRRAIQVALVFVGLALVALLVYSFERTSWLFGLFEAWDVPAQAAAGVVELAAVALIAGSGAIALIDERARAWANRALLSILATQVLANLAAGYLRGGHSTLAMFGGSSVSVPFTPVDARYAVAAVLWLIVNLSVPALILCLSKLLERLIDAYLSLPAESPAIPYIKPTAVLRPLAQATEEPTARASVVLDRECPGCGRAIDAARYGAAKRYGYCRECKPAA